MLKIFGLIVISITMLSCATDQNTPWESIEDYSKARISLELEGRSLTRSSVNMIKSRAGRGESDVWRNKDNNIEIEAWIYIFSLRENVYSSNSYSDLEEQIRRVSGDGFVTFDEEDQIKTKFGPLNYQYYSVSGLNCFFIEYIWGDPYLIGFDGVRNAKPGEVIAGNKILQAYYCETDQRRLQIEDVEAFLQGIEVRGIFWPEGRFDAVNS